MFTWYHCPICGGGKVFDNLFNDKAIKELAGILAGQEANRTAKEVLKEMDIKSIGLDEKLRKSINEVLTA